MGTPQGYYVYAYLDGDKPFYIGKGIEKRAWKHFEPSSISQTAPFYCKLRTILEARQKPEILIIKDGLTEAQGYAIESDLITLVGTQEAGTGPLCNVTNLENPDRFRGTPTICWGREFLSRQALLRDPRCVVRRHCLDYRLDIGWPLEKAATTPTVHGPVEKPKTSRRPIICWNERFPSLSSLCRDPRCLVGLTTLLDRLKIGWTLEEAATNPRYKRRDSA